jgi:hypothetical protein
MILTELAQGRVNGDACKPGCKLRSSIKVLDVEEGIEKTILHCVFRVFAISNDPMDDTEESLAMPFTKLTEGGSFAGLSGCDQLLLAPRSKIANGRGIALCRE